MSEPRSFVARVSQVGAGRGVGVAVGAGDGVAVVVAIGVGDGSAAVVQPASAPMAPTPAARRKARRLSTRPASGAAAPGESALRVLTRTGPVDFRIQEPPPEIFEVRSEER